ncbi:MAG: hypothetical protein VX764_04850 [Planctomycetota bacterium]|nr:hypothetical protein [Planctomycetota bacterium]
MSGKKCSVEMWQQIPIGNLFTRDSTGEPLQRGHSTPVHLLTVIPMWVLPV